MSKAKHEIITFKVPEALKKRMDELPNRSEFIRSAVLAALENLCPLCHGTGTLTLDQKKHWDRFAENHSLQECEICHAHHVVCLGKPDAHLHDNETTVGQPLK
jgi:hypothetical protein